MTLYERLRRIPDEARENGRHLRETDPPEDFPRFLRPKVPPADHPDLDALEDEIAANVRQLKPNGKRMCEHDLNQLDGSDALAVLCARLPWMEMKKHVTTALGPDAPQDQIVKAADNIATWANTRVEELKKAAQAQQ